MLDKQICNEHHETIIHMIRNLGIDATDDCLRQELSDASKEVAALREKNLELKNTLQLETNIDELRHLQYDLEDAQNLLENLLQKLKTSDERYLYFKEYLRNHPKEIE